MVVCIWADLVGQIGGPWFDQKKTFSKYPAAHGLPDGHVPVSQFLSVPVKYDNVIIGQIVMGNPEKDYTTMDVDLIDAMADIYAYAIKKLIY